MPRQPRIVFPGARYHVYDRGNYRADIFESAGARDAFEATLFEAAARFGWILHAYVIMINHFHVGLETPRGNLREGMHWLLSTYAIRFNRFRGEQGHVFQGRYHAKLVQSFATLVNYLHLNLVRAGIISVADLAEYRWCSYGKFVSGVARTFFPAASGSTTVGACRTRPPAGAATRTILRC